MTDAADIVVTRDDRNRAAAVLNIPDDPRDCAECAGWVAGAKGGPCNASPVEVLANDLAEAFARHRVEAVRAFCEKYDLCEHGCYRSRDECADCMR